MYDRIASARRTQYHARIARALEARDATREGASRELARHYDLGEHREEAGRWYGVAAHEAAAVYAHDDVIRLATLAIERSTDADSTVDALLLREEANARHGYRDAQIADLDRLDELSTAPELRCRVLERRIYLLHSSGDRDAELRAIEALQLESVVSTSVRWQSRAAKARGRLHYAKGDYAAAKGAADDAVRLLHGSGTTGDRIDALSLLIDATNRLGDFDGASRLLQEARSLATSGGYCVSAAGLPFAPGRTPLRVSSTIRRSLFRKRLPTSTAGLGTARVKHTPYSESPQPPSFVRNGAVPARPILLPQGR